MDDMNYELEILKLQYEEEMQNGIVKIKDKYRFL